MIEKIEVKSVKTRGNPFHVPAKQWAKWSPTAHEVFNAVYAAMVRQQDFFKHPQQERVSRGHWKTTCWNAAWTAADAVTDAI